MKFPIALAVLSISLFSSASHAATYFFHNDHLGTPQVLTDENQQPVWESAQEPFGETTRTTNEVEQNLRFPGQYFDAETGLHYNYYRDYDPSLGRYQSSDPIGLDGGMSTYGYANQNSNSNVDPYGLACFSFHDFADEVEENRLDLMATLGTLVATEAVGTMPKTPSELRGLGVPKSKLNPYTSQLSRWSSRLNIRALRTAGRTAVGIGAGTVATGAVVFEGFYDWGVIGVAAWNATSFDEDCDCGE